MRSPTTVTFGSWSTAAMKLSLLLGAAAPYQQQHVAGVLPWTTRIERPRGDRPEVGVGRTIADLHIPVHGGGAREAAGDLKRERVVAAGVHPDVENHPRAVATSLEGAVEVSGVKAVRSPTNACGSSVGVDRPLGSRMTTCKSRRCPSISRTIVMKSV